MKLTRYPPDRTQARPQRAGGLAVLGDVRNLEADGAAIRVGVVAAQVEGQAFRGKPIAAAQSS
jgi:hypothetical protein